jgi:hypothetical protein
VVVAGPSENSRSEQSSAQSTHGGVPRRRTAPAAGLGAVLEPIWRRPALLAEDGVLGEDVEPHRWCYRRSLYASMMVARTELVREFRSRRPRRAAQGVRYTSSGAEAGEKAVANPAAGPRRHCAVSRGGRLGHVRKANVRHGIATSR